MTQSFFSMNIIDPDLKNAVANATNITAMSEGSTSFNITNQTALLTSVIAASGGINYKFGLFFGVCLALVAGTVILPVITGPILRLILQSVARYWVYWRMVYPATIFIYFVGVYVLGPVFTPFNPFLQLPVPVAACCSMFQGRGIFRWLKGRPNKRTVLKRFLFLSFSWCCWIIDFQGLVRGYASMLPLMILFWFWFMPSIKGLRS